MSFNQHPRFGIGRGDGDRFRYAGLIDNVSNWFFQHIPISSPLHELLRCLPPHLATDRRFMQYTAMRANGFAGVPNQSAIWVGNNPKISSLEMQRKDGPEISTKNNRKVADMSTINYPYLKDDKTDLFDLIKIEAEENKDQDQIPIVKKYEMLGDLKPNKLKLELEGVHINIKDKNNDLVTKTAVSIDENNVKNNKTKKQTLVYDPKFALGKNDVFSIDEERISIHCQPSAHHINCPIMTKIKKGTKRGIDRITKNVTSDGIQIHIDNSADMNAEFQKAIASEEPAVKHTKT